MKSILFLALLLSPWGIGLSAPSPPPNFVFILIDDLGYADCGFNGGKQIHTPNIDKLASEGAVLESHYVQPVCSPTRAALLSGRYASRTGVYTVVRPHAKWGLPLKERTLADALKASGYSTAIVGKWHLGEFDPAYRPLSRGFDHQHGHFFGAIDNYTHKRDGNHDWYHDDKNLVEEGYSTHLLTREACRLIGAQDRQKPLFLYVPFNAVHAPLQVPEEYLKPYQNVDGQRRQFAGMLAAVDEGIGHIVAALEKSGLRENTLLVFSSDNGGPPVADNKPLRDHKGSLFEGGIRSCAFANWPGKIPAGQRIPHPMHIVDWFPTFLKLAGGSLQQDLPIDGKDVWPMLTEKAPSPHDSILIAKSPTSAALRIGDWKLISDTTPASGDRPAKARSKKKSPPASDLLFNLSSDISESTNLADQEPARLATMKSKLAELLKDAVPSGVPGQEDAE